MEVLEKQNCAISLLAFPVSHIIGGGKPVRKSYHLIVFLKSDEGIFLGEGTPYGSSIVRDYINFSSLIERLQECTFKEARMKLAEYERSLLKKSWRISWGAFLALEMALLDFYGKKRRVRVANILGGVFREKINVWGTVFLDIPSRMKYGLVSWLRKGVKHIKIKIPCSLSELRKILSSLVDDVKEHNVILRADANECFQSIDKAFRALKLMEKYNVSIVEQPMPRDRLREIRVLHKHFYPSLEIMLDESLVHPNMIERIAFEEITNTINIHPSRFGCLTITRETILRAQNLGLKVQIGSSSMTEIGLAGYLHLASSIPRLDYPLEEVGLASFYPSYSILREFFKPVFDIVDGHITLSNKPGIGIDISDLNFEVLKKYSISTSLRDFILASISHVINRLNMQYFHEKVFVTNPKSSA
ncbi:MAG: hypothetical protein DRP01_02315 [Archaeoglobales archaeon]|nr:MAG: hypothetical protein DRP01_02315 [Archaeoglobales archaeon]